LRGKSIQAQSMRLPTDVVFVQLSWMCSGRRADFSTLRYSRDERLHARGDRACATQCMWIVHGYGRHRCRNGAYLSPQARPGLDARSFELLSLRGQWLSSATLIKPPSTRYRVNSRRLRTGLCDVSRRQDVERMIAECVTALGGLGVLVNNAGIGPTAPVEHMDPDEWERSWRLTSPKHSTSRAWQSRT
jgi:hypothetical protein